MERFLTVFRNRHASVITIVTVNTLNDRVKLKMEMPKHNVLCQGEETVHYGSNRVRNSTIVIIMSVESLLLQYICF